MAAGVNRPASLTVPAREPVPLPVDTDLARGWWVRGYPETTYDTEAKALRAAKRIAKQLAGG